MKLKIKEILRKADELDSRWRYIDTNDYDYRAQLVQEHNDYINQEVEIDDPKHHPENKD